MSEKKRWRKVEAPKTWRPAEGGDELIGIYVGSTEIVGGQFGDYVARFIRDDNGETWRISGARVEQLFVGVQNGARVKLIYNGSKPFQTTDGEVRTMKDFDLFTEVVEHTS